MTKAVAFYFDFGSSASYLAAKELPRIARDTGASIDWKPMLLGAVFKATGNRSPAEIPAKGAYLLRDFARFAERYRVPFALNPDFPINTLPLMRAATAVQLRKRDAFERFVDVTFHAMWGEPRNLGDAAVFADVVRAAGLDPAEVLAWSQEQDVKDALRATTDGAIARGVFGAPTMFVGDEMFWGQDRLDFVREALRR